MGRAAAQSHHQHRCRAGGVPLCCSRDSSPKLPRALIALWVIDLCPCSVPGTAGPPDQEQKFRHPSNTVRWTSDPNSRVLVPPPLSPCPFPRSGCPRSAVCLCHTAQPLRLACPCAGTSTDTSSNSEPRQLLHSPRLIGITREQSLCLPGTILRSGQDKGGLCPPWELDPSSLPQGRTEAGRRSTSTWGGQGGQQHPSPSPTSSSPTLWGQQGEISQFPPSAATVEAGGRGLGTQEMLRGDAHVHLESYLIIRRRNQSRC